MRVAVQRSAPPGAVAGASFPVPRGACVPGPNLAVVVTGPHAGHKQLAVLLGPAAQLWPVFWVGTVGDRLARKVGVEAVKSPGQEVGIAVIAVQPEPQKEAIRRAASQGLRATGQQEARPLRGRDVVRVVHVEHRAAGAVAQQSGVLPQPAQQIHEILAHAISGAASVRLQVEGHLDASRSCRVQRQRQHRIRLHTLRVRAALSPRGPPPGESDDTDAGLRSQLREVRAQEGGRGGGVGPPRRAERTV
mmetsp:Transcript_272/g.541  ORF Transcript_272/g.541 Transcript_272/m.541 type:complete len:248 (+) Transcript_272:395-1138(+)